MAWSRESASQGFLPTRPTLTLSPPSKRSACAANAVRRGATQCERMRLSAQVAEEGLELLVRFRGKTYVLTKAGDQLGIISEKARS